MRGTMARAFGVMSVAAAVVMSGAGAARPGDDTHAAKARAMLKKAGEYLRSKQDQATGGWNAAQPSPAPKDSAAPPEYPAITGLAISALLADPATRPGDAAVAQGVKHLLNLQQPDGGIYDRLLPSYNTSIALSALAKAPNPPPQVAGAIARAQAFLQALQWTDTAPAASPVGGADAPRQVARDHPYYGGVGYGKHGRPDNSNLTMMLQALHDSGVSPESESFQRALTFLERTQMLDSVNDMEYADGSKQGGFIYATVPNAESVEGRAGQTYAGTIEETLDDGTKVSRLRCYGSMTYAGFKSYLYAALPREDARVKAALGWIEKNYTVDENPGVGPEGLYYYYVTMARALAAWGEPKVHATAADGKVTDRDWSADLIDKLATLQNEDGSFKSVKERWMENNPVLITSYAAVALGEALKARGTK